MNEDKPDENLSAAAPPQVTFKTTNPEEVIIQQDSKHVNYSNTDDGLYSLDDAIEHMGFGFYQLRLVIIVGLSWMSDAMEMMVVSILAPVLLCEWKLKSYEEALITTVIFIGQGFGSFFFGYIGDVFGRAKSLYISVVLVFLFGIGSSQASTYTWMLILRFAVGIGIGGVPQAVTIATEVLPHKTRGKTIIFLAMFWAIGSVFAAAIAIGSVQQLGWQWFLVLITIPIFIFLILAMFWLPESPRYLMTANRHEEAVKVLEKISKANKKPLPPGRLKPVENNVNKGRALDLFSRKWIRTTVLLQIIWMTSAFSYYGIVLLTTEVFQTNINGCNPHINGTEAAGLCVELKNKDYIDFMTTSVAEFPGLVFAILLIERLGRKRSLMLFFGLSSLAFLSLCICMNRTATVIILFLVRGLVAGSFQVVYLYTPEVLPTNVRAVGLGLCSMLARVGSMVTPFVAQVLIHKSFYLVIIVYATLLLFCVVASFLLTIETSGRNLRDSTEEEIEMEGYSTFN